MKGKANPLLAIAMIVLIAAGGIFIAKEMGLFGVPAKAPTGPAGPPVVTETVCPDDDITTFSVRVNDEEAATTTYVAKSVNALNTMPGSEEIITIGSSSTGYPSTGTSLQCGENYVIYSATNATVAGTAGSGGVWKEYITTAGEALYKTYKTVQLDYAEIRVEDNAADSYQSLFTAAGTSGTNATTYTTLNSTNVFESVAADDIAVGTDGDLDYDVFIRTATARQYFGDPLGRCFAFFDVGSDVEWDEPTVAWNGAVLDDVIDTVAANDLLYSQLNAMDYAYYIGNGKDIDRTGGILNFQIKAASGQDPDTTNDDITIYFGCEGIFKSSQEIDKFYMGIATDATTRAPVTQGTQYIPKLVINIS